MKQAIKKGFKHIRVQGDSLLVCNQVCYLYKVCIFLNIFQIPPIFGSASLGLCFTKIAWMVIKKKTCSKCSQNITWWFEIYSLDSFYSYPSRWWDIVNLRYTDNQFSVFIQFFFSNQFTIICDYFCNRFRVYGKSKTRIWLAYVMRPRSWRISFFHSRSIMFLGYLLNHLVYYIILYLFTKWRKC